jgi:hypothetical protein
MTAPVPAPGSRWFERHPRKTIIFALLLLLLGLTYAAEKVLAYINRTHKMVLFTERRYVNLREYLPHLDVVDIPPDKAMRESDDLARLEYRVRTDANGFILPSNRHERPDLALVFLGGSTVACIYVEEDQRYPYLAARHLEDLTGKKVTSYNSGVGGNNSLHSLDILLNKVIPLKPQMVVLLHNLNDLVALLYDGTYWSANPSRGPIVSFGTYKNIQGFQAVLSLARDMYIPNLHAATQAWRKRLFGKARESHDEFAHARGKKLAYDREAILGEFRLNLETFVALCRARGIVPVLMTQFNRYKADPDDKVAKAMRGFAADTGIPYPEYKAMYDAFNETIRQVGGERGAPVIDLARLIPQDKAYMYDVVHLNTKGSRLAAQIISQHLAPLAR